MKSALSRTNSPFGLSSLKKNFLFNATKIFLGLLFPLITFPYASRILGPEGIGRVGFAQATVAYFIMIAGLGIPLYGTREAAKVRDNPIALKKLVSELLWLNAASTIIAYLLLLGAIIFVPRFSEEKGLILVVSCVIGFTSLGADWLFQALERFAYIALRSFFVQIVSLVLLFVFVRQPSDVLPYAALGVFASAGANILNFAMIRREIGISGPIGLDIKRHIKSILILFGMSLSVSVYANLNSVMLGIYGSAASVGYYLAAVKIIGIVQAVVGSFAIVLLPRSSYHVEHSEHDEFERLIAKAFLFLCLTALPFIVGIIALREEIAVVFAGEAFRRTGFVLGVMSLNIFVVGLSNLFGIQVLIPLGKEKTTFLSTMVGALVCLVLTPLLLPRFSERGAAIAILLTELSVTLVQAVACRRYIIRMLKHCKIFPYILGCCAIVAIAILGKTLFVEAISRIVFIVGLSAIAYIATLFLLNEPFSRGILKRFFHSRA